MKTRDSFLSLSTSTIDSLLVRFNFKHHLVVIIHLRHSELLEQLVEAPGQISRGKRGSQNYRQFCSQISISI